MLLVSGDFSFLPHPAVYNIQREQEHNLQYICSRCYFIALPCWHFDSQLNRPMTCMWSFSHVSNVSSSLFSVLSLRNVWTLLPSHCHYMLSPKSWWLQHYGTYVLIYLHPYSVAAVATETGRKWVHQSTGCLDARAELCRRWELIFFVLFVSCTFYS